MLAIYVVVYVAFVAVAITLISIGVPWIAIVLMVVGWCGGVAFVCLLDEILGKRRFGLVPTKKD